MGYATAGVTVETDPNAVLKALADAKGDVFAATADNTVARVAVGTDGQVLTADVASATGVKWAAVSAGPTYVVKATDETRTSTVVLANDGDLSFAVDANGVYEVECTFVVSSPSAVPGFKWALGGPASIASIFWVAADGSQPHALGADSSTDMFDGSTNITNFEAGLHAATVKQVFHYRGLIFGTYSAGTVNMKWSQKASNINAETLLSKLSFIKFKKLA